MPASARPLAPSDSACCLPQATCDPALNCPGPCWQCNSATNACEVAADYKGTCTTLEGKTGHCSAGLCQVGQQ